MGSFSTATAAVFCSIFDFYRKSTKIWRFSPLTQYYYLLLVLSSVQYYCSVLQCFFLKFHFLPLQAYVYLFGPKRKWTLIGESANGKCLVKKVLFFVNSPFSGHCLTCFAQKDYSHRRLLFFPDCFTRDKNARNSFSKEFYKKRFWNSCFPVKFAKFLGTPFLTEPPRWLLLRATNFVSVFRLCTIQNTSNPLAKAHLRTHFLQSGSQWLLSNVSYFFEKGKIRINFSYLLWP